MSRTPYRLRSAIVAAGLAMSLAVLAMLAGISWSQHREAMSQARERGELMARLFEDQASRSLDASALLLASLSDTIARQPAASGQQSLAPVIRDTMLGQPFIRSVALLDRAGRVLASSAADELGLQLQLDRLGPIRADGREQLLELLPGRHLRDLAADADARSHAGVSMWPMLRALRDARGRELLLIALINPDFFATYQQAALGDTPAIVSMLNLQGRLIAATEGAGLAPGESLAEHSGLLQRLTQRDYGSYVGPGASTPDRQVVAYRLSRNRPLALVVEQREQDVLARWREATGWRALMAAVALLCIAAGAAVVYRSVLAREQAGAAVERAHQAVALRERELSVLMKSVQELIFRTDANGALTFVNARWAALSRDGAEQAVGQYLHELVEPSYRGRVQALFRRDASTGPRAVEASMRGADGSLRRFYISIVPLHARDRIVGFAGSVADVTERYAAQQRLKQELAFTALLLEVSPQPISLIDGKGCYAVVNRAWEEFSGLSRVQVIGEPEGFFKPPAERALHRAQDLLLKKHGGPVRYEAQLQHRDGTRRDVMVTKVLLRDEFGDVTGTLNTLMDVSEFRTAERATREARDAAEEASRAKSEFVANISHELRTPLQSILGFSELGMTRSRAQPKLSEMFGDIHASGQRMLALVNDLLDVSKIESAVGTLDLERCDLRGLVQSVLRELEPLLARRQLQVQLQLPREALNAKVDPLRFQQVLRNVLANAIKFSPEGGGIDVAGGVTSEGEIHLGIGDRGPGIPEAELESIFEAFVQSSQTKDGAGGTGLGLAICRKIVEIHGGRISAGNRPGGGAIFDICLPLRSAAETRPADFELSTPA